MNTSLPKLPKVAFQGEMGAYSEEAVRSWFGEDVTPVPSSSFDEVTTAVSTGQCDFGLIPIENTLSGTVVGGLDALAESQLEVVGEVIRPIRHCLLGVPGAKKEGLVSALSHPVALAQCRGFFKRNPGIDPVVVYDTAGAAREIRDEGDPARAAIAGRRAAELYGLEILEEELQDRDDNQTRFLLVRRLTAAGSGAPASAATKTAILFETLNQPGALLKVLQPLAAHGVNLTNLHSRPGGSPWTYRFFAEIEGPESAAQVQAALREAEAVTSSFRVLGSFAPAPKN